MTIDEMRAKQQKLFDDYARDVFNPAWEAFVFDVLSGKPNPTVDLEAAARAARAKSDHSFSQPEPSQRTIEAFSEAIYGTAFKQPIPNTVGGFMSEGDA